MPAAMSRRLTLSPELELKRKVTVREAAEIKRISESTFRRVYGHLIEQVSPRRQVVTLGKLLED